MNRSPWRELSGKDGIGGSSRCFCNLKVLIRSCYYRRMKITYGNQNSTFGYIIFRGLGDCKFIIAYRTMPVTFRSKCSFTLIGIARSPLNMTVGMFLRAMPHYVYLLETKRNQVRTPKEYGYIFIYTCQCRFVLSLHDEHFPFISTSVSVSE